MATFRFNPRTLSTEQMVYAVVGTVMLITTVLSWVPQPCPVLRRYTVGCQRPPILSTPLSAFERELSRIGHQEVTSPLMYFEARAQDYRKTTIVNFFYMSDSLDEEAELYLKRGGVFHPVATIASPYLSGLNWPSISADGVRLYFADPRYESIDQLFATLPPADQLAVDEATADRYGLRAEQYVPLAQAHDHSDVRFALVAYNPPKLDGMWSLFEYQLDAQAADVIDENLQWQIRRTGSNLERAFRIGSVHINYQSMGK